MNVVAGLEPDQTIAFLIALADCASNDSIDNEVAIQRCLNNEIPGENSILPLKPKPVHIYTYILC